jgi:hypothetical protein
LLGFLYLSGVTEPMIQSAHSSATGPASHLLDVELLNRWRVVERIAGGGGGSGGQFSHGYVVEDHEGRRGYLKAIDYSDALKTPDPARALQPMVDAFNLERDLLEQCKTRRLSRVVKAIESGTIVVPGFAVGTVQYIIFELAEGDVRAQIGTARQFDIAWALRALHHIANGLRQLHQIGVAHQAIQHPGLRRPLFDENRGSWSCLHARAELAL